MIKIKFTLFFSFLIIFIGKAQTIFKGKVLDNNSKQPIEFVNIGIVESTNGTVSDEQGNFTLSIKSNTANINFSSIGYEAKTISVATLKTDTKIYLNPVSYQVKTVQINAQKFGDEKKIGKEIKRKNTVWGTPFIQHLGGEIGMRIKINRETMLKSAHFGMHARSADSVLFRINLYDYKNGQTGKNLISKNIYAFTHEIANYGTIDLSDLNLIVYDDVLLSLQIVKKEGGFVKDNNIFFRIKTWLYDSNILYREASQTEFKKPKREVVNDRIGFYLLGKQAGKTKKLKTIQSPIIEPTPSLNNWQDSLAYLFQQSTIPGLALTIIKQDSIAFQQTYGQANVAEDIKYTNQTTQPIASISKTFIGLALMQLIEKGHFTLETPINDILPFKVVNPYTPDVPITVKHLVTHTAGIRDTSLNYYHQYYIKKGESLQLPTSKAMRKTGLHVSEGMPLADYLKATLSVEGALYHPTNFLEEGAGKVYLYSNNGSSLAAYLVEITTGQSYADYVKANIFKPLGMKSTAFDRSDANQKKLATLYASKSFPLPEYSHPSYPDGNVSTSNHDISLYLMEMIRGANGKGILLSKEGYETLFSRKSPAHFNGKNGGIHGVFWDLVGNRIEHSGGDYGVIALLSFNPKTNSGFHVMANINPDDIGKELRIDAHDIFNQLATLLDLVRDFEERK